MPTVTFVKSPSELPDPPPRGRVALVDLAFAFAPHYEQTRLFRVALGDRLALWVDHHDHPAWEEVRGNERYVLAGKREARACPELVTPEVVARAGTIDHILAHADLDGCMAAAKLARGGVAPYPEADEDARFADSPGQGFSCSARGRRYLAALDRLEVQGGGARLALLRELYEALVTGHESDAFVERLEGLARELEQHQRALARRLDAARRIHPDVLVVRSEKLSTADRKFLLRCMEEQARVGIVDEGSARTAATFDDEVLDLRTLPRCEGYPGYAWTTTASLDELLQSLVAMLQRWPRRDAT